MGQTIDGRQRFDPQVLLEAAPRERPLATEVARRNEVKFPAEEEPAAPRQQRAESAVGAVGPTPDVFGGTTDELRRFPKGGVAGRSQGEVVLHPVDFRQVAAGRRPGQDLHHVDIQLRDAQGVAAANEDRPVPVRRLRAGVLARDGPRELHQRAVAHAAPTEGPREVVSQFLRVHRREEVFVLLGRLESGSR